MSDVDDVIAIEAWNTVLFDKFCRFRYVLTEGLSGHSDELLRRRPFPAGARVLDVGCGFGDTTQRIAAHVTAGGGGGGGGCAPGFFRIAGPGGPGGAGQKTFFSVRGAA